MKRAIEVKSSFIIMALILFISMPVSARERAEAKQESESPAGLSGDHKTIPELERLHRKNTG